MDPAKLLGELQLGEGRLRQTEREVRAEDEAVLDGLFARYTMEREREVHREFLRKIGVTSVAAARPVETHEAADDGIELF